MSDWHRRLGPLPSITFADGSTVHEAASPVARLRGLAGVGYLPAERVLQLTPCRSVHTFGMRFPLDLVWLGEGGRVLRVDARVRPRRIRSCPRARSVLEMRGGTGETFVRTLHGAGYTAVR